MRKGVVLLACFFICAICCAQQYPFVYYTPKDGLVNSRVRKIYQDSKGRLYFLTFGGLSVYDGVRFRNYTVQNGLAVNMVNDVIEVGDDSLLVATNTNKLNILVQGKIKTLQTENNFHPTVNQFLKSRDGAIYVTADEGLFKLTGKKFEALPFEMLNPGIPPFLGNILEFHDVFILTTNDLRGFAGLYLYDKKNKRLLDAIPGAVVGTLGKDKTDRIWMTVTDSVCMLDQQALENGKLKIVALPFFYRQVARFPASSFAFDDNHTWTVYNGRQIIRTGKDGSLLQLRMPDEQGQGDIGRVFIDKENIVWVCSSGAGVFKLVNTTLQINETFQNKISPANIYYASYVRDTTWGLLTNQHILRKTASGIQVFSTNHIPYIFAVKQLGHRLLASTLTVLYSASLPSTSETKIYFQPIRTLPNSSSFRGIIITDPYNNTIVSEKDGITVFRNNRLLFKYPVKRTDLIEGLQFDSQNRLWLTTRGSGITVFTLHPDHPDAYLKPVYLFVKELTGISPRCMILDKKDIVWVGTRDHGLLVYTLQKSQLKKIAQYQTRQGLTDNFITALALDSSNNILAGTQTGLDRIIKNGGNEYRIENITKRNGVFGYIYQIWVESDNQSFAILNNGTILQITPVQASVAKYDPSLFVEEIKVNGTTLYSGIKNLKLPYSQRNLSFNVAAPAFADEQQVQYSYLLQGSGNNEWSEPSGNADFNFLNLAPGKYLLKVKASFPSTDYLPRDISLPFTIIPPWWKTLWFRILAAVLFIGAVWLGIRFYYKRKLEKQRTVLEKQQAIEKERTRIATDMHDDLGAGLSRIKFLSETIGIKKQREEPIEEDIGKIREYSHDMIDKMGEIVWALNEKNDSLSDLLSYTRAYAVEYLSQNGIHCTVTAPDQFPVIFVSGEFRRNIYLTVKEALHNIVKHAQATESVIHFDTAGNISIVISDNGKGLGEKKINPFSNGFTNMKKRMESLGGRWEIKSNGGITITLTAPLPLSPSA